MSSIFVLALSASYSIVAHLLNPGTDIHHLAWDSVLEHCHALSAQSSWDRIPLPDSERESHTPIPLSLPSSQLKMPIVLGISCI
jgi:hypothetical protein